MLEQLLDVSGLQIIDGLYLIKVLCPKGVHDYLVSVFQVLEVHEWTGQSAGEVVVAGQNAVTVQRWKGGPFQVAGIFSQPRDIPGAVLQRNSHDIHLHILRRDLEPEVAHGLVLFIHGLQRQEGHGVWRKPGDGDSEGIHHRERFIDCWREPQRYRRVRAGLSRGGPRRSNRQGGCWRYRHGWCHSVGWSERVCRSRCFGAGWGFRESGRRRWKRILELDRSEGFLDLALIIGVHGLGENGDSPLADCRDQSTGEVDAGHTGIARIPVDCLVVCRIAADAIEAGAGKRIGVICAECCLQLHRIADE